jgi:hypothetical protein
MQKFFTQYGELKEISNYLTYENGHLESLSLNNENKLNTCVGTLIPRYKDYTGRRKSTNCLSFYKSGAIKSIDIQKQTTIPTSLGNIEAELVTFYESGSIKRIFPLNGSLSGFWSEDEEAELCKPISFNLLNTNFDLKINSIFFYPNGNIKSVSFFPKETAIVPTPCGNINTRIGLSLSDKGNLLTLEPAFPVEVPTPIGILHAYDSNAIGIYADKNSLVFDNKNISQLVSSTDIIKITDKTGKLHRISPYFIRSLMNPNENELVPIRIIFYSDFVTFISSSQITINYSDIADIKLTTIPLFNNQCTDCASCGKCN